MTKRGITLIELLVAMAIFLIIITVAVGAFTSVVRMKALTSTMKESQQKTRIALEMITRLSRQAEKIVIPDANDEGEGKILYLYFDTSSAAPLGSKFEITGGGLEYGECDESTGFSLTCAENITETTNLYDGLNLDSTVSVFQKIGTIPPTLSMELYSDIGGIDSSTYYSDDLSINTTVILEGIR